jgi:DNA invertase Pin-like site-specific DNA recombinase
MLAFVRDGDTMIVHSMDRLARNLDYLRRLVRLLNGQGVRVETWRADVVRQLSAAGQKRRRH